MSLGLTNFAPGAELNVVAQKLREPMYKEGCLDAFAGSVKALMVVPLIGLLKDVVGYGAGDTQAFRAILSVPADQSWT